MLLSKDTGRFFLGSYTVLLPTISKFWRLSLNSGAERNMNIKFGYTIIYVPSVKEALDFYKRAFGFEIKMILDSGEWGELNTGATTLSFAAHEMGRINLDDKYQKADIKELPFGIELSFITDDVQAVFDRAVSAGAIPLREPAEKPWGQTVSYVRAMDGTVIEIATQVGE